MEYIELPKDVMLDTLYCLQMLLRPIAKGETLTIQQQLDAIKYIGKVMDAMNHYLKNS